MEYSRCTKASTELKFVSDWFLLTFDEGVKVLVDVYSVQRAFSGDLFWGFMSTDQNEGGKSAWNSATAFGEELPAAILRMANAS